LQIAGLQIAKNQKPRSFNPLRFAILRFAILDLEGSPDSKAIPSPSKNGFVLSKWENQPTSAWVAPSGDASGKTALDGGQKFTNLGDQALYDLRTPRPQIPQWLRFVKTGEQTHFRDDGFVWSPGGIKPVSPLLGSFCRNSRSEPLRTVEPDKPDRTAAGMAVVGSLPEFARHRSRRQSTAPNEHRKLTKPGSTNLAPFTIVSWNDSKPSPPSDFFGSRVETGWTDTKV